MGAAHELANLRTRLADQPAELLNRMQKRRQIIQRYAEQDVARSQ
jgi:hypothetical protein